MNANTVSGRTFLSKTLFIKGLQCSKYLWLEKNQPELKDKISKSLETVFQSGTDVGMLARNLFAGGIEIPYEGISLSKQIELTAQTIANGADTIYEAAFLHDGIFIKADILHRDAQGWNLYEVKSSTGMSDVYYHDVSVQYYVINGAGIPVNKAYLVHINNKYVRRGDIDVHGLFTMEDITTDVIAEQSLIPGQAAKMRAKLQGDMPVVDIGPHCKDPYDCQFMGTCWQHVPADSIFSIEGRLDRFSLYNQGIVNISDVPIEKLSNSQRMQVEGFINKKDFINKDALREFLGSLWYPLCFFDFETTYMTPVPLFDGTRPYQQVPFQYSLHKLANEGSELEHYEYLATAGADPREELLESLLAHIPENACVLVYNKTFEISRLKELKEWLPRYTAQIDTIITNIRDLMVPFRQKDIYLWQFGGSHSIKTVLPLLVPELGYDALDIGDGVAAANAWLGMWKMDDPTELEKTRTALFVYCGLDTLAMVRIMEKLVGIAN